MKDENAVAPVAPRLWNPGAAFWWSLLFGPLFGIVLHWKNWTALRQPTLAGDSRRWFWIMLLILLVLGALNVADVLPHTGATLDVVLLVSWYRYSGRAQCRHVAEAYGQDYPRRSLGLPLVLASACMLTVMGLLILITYMAPQGAELA